MTTNRRDDDGAGERVHEPVGERVHEPAGERVIVFIDGQNLVKAVTREFGTRVHPVLLGRHLAKGRQLVQTRYYSGIHQPRINAKVHALATRRHKLIRRTGVEVIERQLQYHWEWSIVDRLPPPHRAEADAVMRTKVEKRRVAREKGIDMALGLDAVAAAFSDQCDTLVVVSRDRDLVEIAKEIKERARTRDVKVEVALVAGRNKRVLDGYDYTHWIDSDVVDEIRDDFDYKQRLRKADVDRFLERVNPAGKNQPR